MRCGSSQSKTESILNGFTPYDKINIPLGIETPLMSRMYRKYCSISTSYLAGLFDILVIKLVVVVVVVVVVVHFHINSYLTELHVLVTFYQWTLCDTYHKEFESH